MTPTTPAPLQAKPPVRSASITALLASALAAAVLAACGGGGDAGGDDAGSGDTGTGTGTDAGGAGTGAPVPPGGLPVAADLGGVDNDAAAQSRSITIAQRTAAARQTASTNAQCQAIAPFYWSVGDGSGTRADDRVGTGAPFADTKLSIASASKMIYGAYVAQLRAGAVTPEDVKYMTFTSGYTQFDQCLPDQTVAQCQSYQGQLIHNGGYVAANDGKFYYSGGHMMKHATLPSVGLGPDADDALAQAVDAMLGAHMDFHYSSPQLPGGVVASASDYGLLLQRLVNGQLALTGLLGTHKVCTNPLTCANAVYTPIPLDESWHYAIGHWVEDDPVVGDGAYSSAGAFGFYPWVDHTKQWWGVISREDLLDQDNPDPHKRSGVMSAYCGRQIRAAWMTGVAR